MREVRDTRSANNTYVSRIIKYSLTETINPGIKLFMRIYTLHLWALLVFKLGIWVIYSGDGSERSINLSEDN
jgi:hypothetical protein